MNIKKILCTLSMCMGLGAASTAFSAPVSEQEWEFSPGVTQVDAEWLRLTRAGDNFGTSHIHSKKTYAPAQTIHVEFDYLSWGGKEGSGDGISLYLFDAGVPGGGTGGYHGGALGYCRQVGAYLGIGLDEYGTFASRFCEGGDNKNPLSRNNLTIRGAQVRGYALVGTFPLKTPLACKGPDCMARQQAMDKTGFKRVVADFIPQRSGPGYTVNVSINGEMIASAVDYPYTAPASMKIGIAGSNGELGGANHEIRNLQVDTFGDACVPAEVNLASGIPAYISSPIVDGKWEQAAYPILNDGDDVQKGWDGIGPWTGIIKGAAVYGLDWSGAPCNDGTVLDSCPQPPTRGNGPVAMNTAVVYFRQDDGKEHEPDDSTMFTQYGGVVFILQAYETLLDGTKKWTTLEHVSDNNRVKRTFTFPTKQVQGLHVHVQKTAGNGEAPAVVELKAYNR